MNRKLNRAIKKRFGRKGLKFSKSVGKNLINSSNILAIMKSLKSGFQRYKDTVYEKEELPAHEEFNESLKTYIDMMASFIIAALYGLDYAIYPEKNERVSSLEKDVEYMANDLKDEVDAGRYKFMYNECDTIDQIKFLGERLFVNTMMVNAEFNEEELNCVYKSFYMYNSKYADEMGE